MAWVKRSMPPPPQSDSNEEAGSAADGVARLESLIATLQARNAELLAIVAVRNARIAELERQLGPNSGKPPFSDGPRKHPARVGSLRERSGKRPGGQPGHPGGTPGRVETPDATVGHYPATRAGCGGHLAGALAAGRAARQVFDPPGPRPPIVTERRAFACRCGNCGAGTRANCPADVTAPVRHGPRLAAVVAYLLHLQSLPGKRLATPMADLFGAHPPTAAIAGMSLARAARLRGFAAAARGRVAAAPVKRMDETGFRIGGKTQWPLIASTILPTFRRTSPKRGGLPENVLGIVAHDHRRPHHALKGVPHALRSAHPPRELQVLVEIEGEDRARRMRRPLRRACHASNPAHERGVPLPPGPIAPVERCRDAILAEDFAVIRSPPPTARRQRWDIPQALASRPDRLIAELRSA